MSNYTRNTVTTIGAVNAELEKIEQSIEDKFDRSPDSGQANQLNGNLDVNSNRIYNIPEPTTDSDVVSKGYVDETVDTINSKLQELDLDLDTLDQTIADGQAAIADFEDLSIERLEAIGFQIPVEYVTGIEFLDLKDSSKTIESEEIIYAIKPSAIPFTTTGVWDDDKENFFVVQGVTSDSAGAITGLVFDTLADAISGTLPSGDVIQLEAGDYISTGGYYARNDGGGAKYQVYPSGTFTTGSGVFDVYDSGDGSVQLRLVNTSQVVVSKLGVIDSASTSEDRIHNSEVINFAFSNYRSVIFDKLYNTEGSMYLKNGLTVTGLNQIYSGIKDFHASESAITDGTITNPDSQGNNLWGCNIRNMSITSENSNAFHITPYQCEISRCRIHAKNGAGILFHDGGYQVENVIKENYFWGCLNGILAPGGFRGPTDQYILNNYFYGGGVSERHINLTNASGSLFQGNHYYGYCDKEYLRISSCINTRLIGEYFEGNQNNAHIKLVGGNPNLLTISGCDFWKGDGSTVDWEGDSTCCVKLSFSKYNPFQLSFSACSFREGANDMPIIGITNGNKSDTGSLDVILNDDNIISGSYKLFERLQTSSVATTAVTSNHERFKQYINTQNADFVNGNGGVIYSGSTGSATSFPQLPADNTWLTNKSLDVVNISQSTSLSFSSSGGSTVGGLNPIPPKSKAKIIKDTITGNYEYLIVAG